MEHREILAERAYDELLDLLLWFHHQGPVPIIIGGWAVYCYNSYIGSVDIDLVGPSMGGLFDATLEGFERERGYTQVTTGPLYLGASFRKPIVESGRLRGYMEIDACTYEADRRVFKENTAKELPYEICQREGMLTSVSLGPNCEAYIPNKALLFLYKLKALRDRQHDLEEQVAVMSQERAEWLRAKIVKDGSDLISLLDPNPGPRIIEQKMDSVILRELIIEFDLAFCIESIKSLPTMNLSLRQYRNVDQQNVNEWVTSLINEIE